MLGTSESDRPCSEGSIGLARLATCDEVRYAMSVSSQGTLDLVRACDDFPNIGSYLSDRVCRLPEDIVWLAIFSGALDSVRN
jgi:hypothetical protein